MKILKNNDENIFIVKFTIREREIIEYILDTDNFFNSKFNIDYTFMNNEYLLTKKSDLEIVDCLKYLRHIFANEMIDSVIRKEKIKKIKNDNK